MNIHESLIFLPLLTMNQSTREARSVRLIGQMAAILHTDVADLE
jgi:hypothetical protein